MHDLVQLAKQGKLIGVLSDGEDPQMLSNHQRIIEMAKGRNPISVFGVGIGGDYRTVMKKVADETGGKFYFTN